MAIGRNELCPCGSGKKYKKCCLARKDYWEETVHEIAHNEGLIPEAARVFINSVKFIKSNDAMGFCHAISSVLYVLYSELGLNTEIFIGEAFTPEGNYFDHSWVKVNNKVIDASVVCSLDHIRDQDPVFMNFNVILGQDTNIKYGVSSGDSLSSDTHFVLALSFRDYMDNFPRKDGLWGVAQSIAEASGFNININTVKNKYQNVKRINLFTNVNK